MSTQNAHHIKHVCLLYGNMYFKTVYHKGSDAVLSSIHQSNCVLQHAYCFDLFVSKILDELNAIRPINHRTPLANMIRGRPETTATVNETRLSTDCCLTKVSMAHNATLFVPASMHCYPCLMSCSIVYLPCCITCLNIVYLSKRLNDDKKGCHVISLFDKIIQQVVTCLRVGRRMRVNPAIYFSSLSRYRIFGSNIDRNMVNPDNEMYTLNGQQH